MALLSFQNASIFQKEKLILSDVTFKIEKAEFLYLIGKVGSGKTSLIKTIYGELPLKYGSAQVVGYNLEKLKAKEIPFLRRKVGIVFQDFQLLPDRNIHDNLKTVLKATGWSNLSKIKEHIKKTLMIVGLSDKEYAMPHQLSGGEQQRIVIARSILNSPEIILADEPTGNLDPETGNGIMQLFMDIKNSGTSVLMATHNYQLINQYPARILRLNNGKLYEENEILESKMV